MIFVDFMNKIFLRKGFVLLTTAIFLVGGFFVGANLVDAAITSTFTANQTVANVATSSAVTAIKTLTLSADLIAGDTVNLTVDGVAVSQAFTTDNDTTVAALAVKIDAEPGIATAVVTNNGSNDHDIVVTAQTPGTDFVLGSLNVTHYVAGTAGLNQTTNTANAVDVTAIKTLTLSADLIAGDTVNLTVDGVAVSQAFTTDNDTTVAALAVKIDAEPGIATAVVTNNGSNDHDIVVTAQTPGTDFVLGSLNVTHYVAGTAGLNQTTNTANAVAVSAVAQVVTFTPVSVTATETFRVNINGTNYNYTATTGNTVDDVVTALAPLIDANTSAVCTEDNLKITCTATPAGTAFASYSSTVVDTVAPVITRLGLSPVTIEYGSTYSDAGATALDNVDGDLTGSISMTGSVNTSVVGTYTLHFNVSDVAGNAATEVTRTVNVTTRVITVISAANTKTYDGLLTAAGTPTVTSGTLAIGDVGTFTESYDNKNVGTTHVLTPAGTIKNGSNVDVTANYSITFTTISTGVINARAITVTAATDTKTYSGTTSSSATPTITTGSLVSGDSATWTQTFDTQNVDISKTLTPVGTVTDGNSGNNYSYTFVNNTTGVITVLHITGNFTANNKVYDGNNTATVASRSLNNVVGLDDVTLSGGTATFDDENVANGKTVTLVGATLSGSASGNYILDSVSTTTANITKAPLTITAVDNTKVYGTANPILTANYAGFVNSETSSVLSTPISLATTADTTTGVGSVAITASNAVGANYNISFVPGTLTITIKPVTVTADAKSKERGTADPALTYTVNPALISGDAFTGALTRTAGETVGNHSITQGTLALSSNYVLTYVPANLTISDTITPTLTTYTVSQTVISPNADGVKDSSSIDIEYSEQVTGEINILNSLGVLVKNLYPSTVVTNPQAKVWDGKNNSNVVVADGVYTIQVLGTDSGGNVLTDTSKTITVDNAVPVITRSGSSPVILEIHNIYTDAGATATDNFDGNLTSSITTNTSGVNKDVVGSYTVTYNVVDTNGNNAIQVTRVVNVIDSIANAFDVISSTLVGQNIANNLDTVTTDNVQAFSGLYFEKSISDTPMGQLTFSGALDLSNSATQTFLSNLGTELDQANGRIALNVSTSTVFSNPSLGATLLMYNIMSPIVVGNIIVRNDAGTIISPTGVVSGFSYDSNLHRVAFTAVHFTQFDIDTTPPVITRLGESSVSIVYGSTYTDAGATATDTMSGNLTSSVATSGNITSTTPVGTYTIRYNVSDNAGNAATEVTRTVTVTPKAITVTAVANTKTHDSNTSTTAIPTVTGGLVSDDVANFTETYDNANIGTGKTLVPSGSVTDGNGGNNYTVTFVNNTSGIILATTQSTPQVAEDGSADATLNSSKPEVVITNPTQQVDVTISSGTTNPTIDVSSFITSGTGTLPAINIVSANANNTTVAIPTSTTVTSADTSWNGVIAAPTITTVTLPSARGESKTLSTAIEVGFSGAKLSFNKGVRLLLPDQSGKRAGYSRSGSELTEITDTCSGDSQAVGDALATDAECKINVGSDLVIWTRHFTSFAAFTSVTVISRANVGGGGSSFAVAVAPAPVGQVLGVTMIVGCGDRTTGFSTVTGQPCASNSLTTTSITSGQVLGATKFNFTSVLRNGSKGNEVMELQKFLKNIGYNVGTSDGKFGAKTKTALIKFQIANKLKGDGVVGPKTRMLLNK